MAWAFGIRLRMPNAKPNAASLLSSRTRIPAWVLNRPRHNVHAFLGGRGSARDVGECDAGLAGNGLQQLLGLVVEVEVGAPYRAAWRAKHRRRRAGRREACESADFSVRLVGGVTFAASEHTAPAARQASGELDAARDGTRARRVLKAC